MSWKKILLKAEFIYSSVEDDKNKAEEVIQEKDPKLYDKLNAHFKANPLINDEAKQDAKDPNQAYLFPEDFDAEKGFHWREAFIKYGMGDGAYEELTERVVEYIESLGYTVHEVSTAIHNTYIGAITKGD